MILELESTFSPVKIKHFFSLSVLYSQGVFTVPQSGVWRVSFSLISEVNSGDTSDTEFRSNTVYIFHNDSRVTESKHFTSIQWYSVQTTGGRELIRRAEQGDTLGLETATVNSNLWRIMTCFEFLSP